MKRKFILEYLVYQSGKRECNGWWELKNGYCYNRNGGKHQHIPGDDDIIVEADDWSDLDYSHLLVKDSLYGWINPQGDFYGCNYRDHSALAELYLHKCERQLEKDGWIKIYKDAFDGEPTWYCDKLMITEAQKITLERKGLEVDEDACVFKEETE